VQRAPVLKRDTVGTFEARLRWSARWKWLAPVLLVLAVALGVGLWIVSARRGDGGLDRTREEALSLLALDDAASVDEAAARLSAIVMKRPKLRAAAADRALALAIHAAGMSEETEALAARAATAREERERARREEAPGWEAVERAANAEAVSLEGEIRIREDKTRALSSGAREQLVVLQAEAGETPEVLRALAVLHAFTGERDRLHRVVRTFRDSGLRDAWVDLADGWGDARDPDRGARERSLVKLGAVAAARPDLIRGRYLLARAQLTLGKRAEAIATLDGVLATNPRHERAKRAREELFSPPAPAAVAPAAPPPPQVEAVPPPGKPPARAKKPIPQRPPAPSAPEADAAGPIETASPPESTPTPSVQPGAPGASASPSPAPAAPPPTAPAEKPPPLSTQRRER
jgi:hypothetical protein